MLIITIRFSTCMSLKFLCSGQTPRDLSEHWGLLFLNIAWTSFSNMRTGVMQYPTKTSGSMVVRGPVAWDPRPPNQQITYAWTLDALGRRFMADQTPGP